MKRFNWVLSCVKCFALLACCAILIASSADGASILIDFGRDDVNLSGGNQGAITPSPDVNGNYWNNFSREPNFQGNATSLALTPNASISNLVTVANVPTTIDLKLTGGLWEANGAANGGLTNPSAALLGNFAIPTATRDYFFYTQGANATMSIGDLNPNATYSFRMFGTRDNGSVRTSEYKFAGGNGVFSASLQTSGAGSGSAAHPNANDDTIVSVNGVTPDGSNAIGLTLTATAGGFAYLGIMEITETLNVPEPGTAALSALAGLAAVWFRRRAG